MALHNANFDRLSVNLENEAVRTPLQPSILGTRDSFRPLLTKQGELVLPLNECKKSKRNFERKSFQQEVIIKAMTGSARQLQRKMSSLQDEIILLHKISEGMMGGYREETTVARRRTEKMARRVPSRFIGMETCISRAIPK